MQEITLGQWMILGLIIVCIVSQIVHYLHDEGVL